MLYFTAAPKLGMHDLNSVGLKWLGGEAHERQCVRKYWWLRKRCVEANCRQIDAL